jgi:hypothetical protein
LFFFSLASSWVVSQFSLSGSETRIPKIKKKRNENNEMWSLLVAGGVSMSTVSVSVPRFGCVGGGVSVRGCVNGGGGGGRGRSGSGDIRLVAVLFVADLGWLSAASG